MIQGHLLLSGAISAILVINHAVNGICDPEFIAQVAAEKKKRNHKFGIKGFDITKNSSFIKKTPKFLRIMDDTVCYDGCGAEVPGCNCDLSCSTCGFYDNPIGAGDCIVCADGSDVHPVYEDGTGLCGDTTYCLDENWDLIPGCECHPSCLVCGLYDNPINADDCLMCKNYSEVNPVYNDGSGTCN